jgi:hypothetical protein
MTVAMGQLQVPAAAGQHPFPRRLKVSDHQPPLSEAVIRTAASRADSIMLPRSLTLAWASRAESLREAS